MFKHRYVNGDLEVMLECDVCEQVVPDLELAECIFPDAEEGEVVRPIMGHSQCTRRYEAKTGFVYNNNISMGDYVARIGEDGGGYGMFVRDRETENEIRDSEI